MLPLLSEVCVEGQNGWLPTHTPLVHAVAPVQLLQFTPMPQAASVLPGWQMPFASQQPFGQVAELHTQLPFTHAWVAAHCRCVPHVHVPLVQESARPLAQAVQATPLLAQFALVGTWQELLRQQLFGHESASQTHTPPLQRLPGPHGGPLPHWQAPVVQLSVMNVLHAEHAAPAVPQVVTVRLRHCTLASQQPNGQDTLSQTQVPFRQR
jgi:hypothetical protein